MANPFSNKKKVRGWKTQLKRLENLKNAYLNINLEELNEHKRFYVKIWIDPWDRLVKRNPPFWFRREILKALIEIYLSWDKSLSQLNMVYYLKIWMFDQRFYNSQVVAASGDSINYYDNLFHPTEANIDFPQDKYFLDGNILDTFAWDSFLDEDFFFEKLEELPEYFINRIRKMPHKEELVEIEGGKDTCFIIKKGYLWLGTLKEKGPNAG